MSIASRMTSYQLLRSATTLDAYGMMTATPTKITDIDVSITKNQPTHNHNTPLFVNTEYIGITNYDGVAEGDILKDISNVQYQVRGIGNKGTKYRPLFLDKI